MMLFKRLLLLLLVIFCPVFAEEGGGEEGEEEESKYPLEELFKTETVFPQEKGEVQLTLFPFYSKGKEEGEDERSLSYPFMIEYGITDSLTFEVEFEVYKENPFSEEGCGGGIGDLAIGLKYSWMNICDCNWNAAIGAEVLFPTGDIDRELTEGFREYEIYVILAKDFPCWNYAQVFLHTGFGFVDRAKHHDEEEDDEPAAHEFFLNAGFYYPIRDCVVFSTEFNWETNEWNNHGEENELYITPGITFTKPCGFEWGIGASFGLNHKSDDYQIIGKLVYEFSLCSGCGS